MNRFSSCQTAWAKYSVSLNSHLSSQLHLHTSSFPENTQSRGTSFEVDTVLCRFHPFIVVCGFLRAFILTANRCEPTHPWSAITHCKWAEWTRVIRAARWRAINPPQKRYDENMSLHLSHLTPSLSSSLPPIHFATHSSVLSSFYPSVAARRRRVLGEFLSRIHNHLSTWGVLVCMYVCVCAVFCYFTLHLAISSSFFITEFRSVISL